MQIGTVLWVDLQTLPVTLDLSAQVALFCTLCKMREIDKVADSIRALTPRIVFFEYDHPSPELLSPLKRLVSDFPELRFVMITRQHSENLAVWALRARVWDYLVKPVDLFYLLSRIEVLLNQETGAASTCEKISRLEQEMTPNRTQNADFTDRLRIGNENRIERCNNQLTPAMSFVKANYAEKVTLGEAATLCGLGRYQFSRAFKRAHGTTFREFVIIHRIQKAEQMLCLANISITDVAFSVGFNDLSHFAQMFRRYVGVRPSEYVQRTKSKVPRLRNLPALPGEIRIQSKTIVAHLQNNPSLH